MWVPNPLDAAIEAEQAEIVAELERHLRFKGYGPLIDAMQSEKGWTDQGRRINYSAIGRLMGVSFATVKVRLDELREEVILHGLRHGVQGKPATGNDCTTL